MNTKEREYIKMVEQLDKKSKEIISNYANSLDDITILSNNIAQGIILRIHFKGCLKEDGYEIGVLLMGKNSRILKHSHKNFIEIYQSYNESVINGNENFNICELGNYHYAVNNTQKPVLVIYVKIKVIN